MRAAKHPHLYVPDLRHKCCCHSVGFFRQHVEEAPSSCWGALQQQICKDHAWKQHSTAQHSTKVGYSNQLACNWCWALKLAYLAAAAFAHLMILLNISMSIWLSRVCGQGVTGCRQNVTAQHRALRARQEKRGTQANVLLTHAADPNLKCC